MRNDSSVRLAQEANRATAAIPSLTGESKAKAAADLISVKKRIDSAQTAEFQNLRQQAFEVSSSVSRSIGKGNRDVSKILAAILGGQYGPRNGGADLGAFIDRYA